MVGVRHTISAAPVAAMLRSALTSVSWRTVARMNLSTRVPEVGEGRRRNGRCHRQMSSWQDVKDRARQLHSRPKLRFGEGGVHGVRGLSQEKTQRHMHRAHRPSPPRPPPPAWRSTRHAPAMRINGVLPMQTHKGADGAHQTFGGDPVGDDLTCQHRVQQLGQLPVENPVQRRMHRSAHRRQPLPENSATPSGAIPMQGTTTKGQLQTGQTGPRDGRFLCPWAVMSPEAKATLDGAGRKLRYVAAFDHLRAVLTP